MLELCICDACGATNFRGWFHTDSCMVTIVQRTFSFQNFKLFVRPYNLVQVVEAHVCVP